MIRSASGLNSWELPLRSTLIKFESFSVSFVIGYMNVPSIPFSNDLLSATSLPRINREDSGDLRLSGDPTKLRDVPRTIDEITRDLSAKYIERTKWLLQQQNVTVQDGALDTAAKMSSFLTPDPLVIPGLGQ